MSVETKSPGYATRRADARHVQAAPIRRSLVETFDFGPDPGELRMLSYVPRGSARDAALVVVLHGCGQTAQDYAIGAGWVALADRLGFALLCPEQRRANNPGRCFNWFSPLDTHGDCGEAASVVGMIETMLLAHRLDRGRVFISGLSAGGALALAMMAAYPRLFAAGAVIAAMPVGAATGMHNAFRAMVQGVCRPARVWGDQVRGAALGRGPWPRLSVWHGEADATVAPENARQIIAQWGDVHGLPAVPTRTESVGADHHEVWESGAGEPVVELHMLKGLGHGAPLATAGPEGCGRAGPFLLETGLSSSLEICRFWGLLDVAELSRVVAMAPLAREAAATQPARRIGGVRELIGRALRVVGLSR